MSELREDFSQRVGARFMVGVYLAVNALRDLFLLVEGPDCVHIKTQYVQGNHDWLSTLTSVSGLHRVANTALHPDHMSGSRETAVRDLLLRMAQHEAVPALALTSMPMAFVTGADYERLVTDVGRETGKPVIHVPGKSLSRDWLDGYAEVLTALAAKWPLPDAEKRPDAVAVVGHLFDRNEGDHVANIAELRRLVEGLGLELVSVWLGGQSVRDLGRVAEASTLISLPYGRKAARRLAKRTGAQLVETTLPLGLPATEAWLRQVAVATGREDRVEALLGCELARVVPRLEWVVPFMFQNRRFGYQGDPHILPGLASYLEVLGARLELAVVTNRPAHLGELSAELSGIETLVYPTTRQLSDCFRDRRGALDLLIASDLSNVTTDVACFELGFPSPTRHALYDRPFLGFGGALALADSFANALSQHALRRAVGSRQGKGA